MANKSIRYLTSVMVWGLAFFLWGAFFSCKNEVVTPRERLLLDFNWKFHQGDPIDADTSLNYPEVENLGKIKPEQIQLELILKKKRLDPVANRVGEKLSFIQTEFDDSKWHKLNLPHDWAVELPFDSLNSESNFVGHGCKAIGGPRYKENNIGWYRRVFELENKDLNKTLWIEFDGVYRNSLVWLNGKCLGRNVSGYSGFKYDITPYVNHKGKNTLVVRVDASRYEGWWYEGAGIYRHVWLVKTNKLHVSHWGTFISTTVKENEALNLIQTEIQNDSETGETCVLVSSIFDYAGKLVAETVSEKLVIPARDTIRINQDISFENPNLWSTENPNLYKLVSKVKIDEKIVDHYETTFGVRTVEFKPDSGFYLNGKHTYLKGACIHQDHAGVGTAIPDRLQYFRIEKLKEMGCNAIRTSHNPPTPELLDVCDKLGMLVVDETRRCYDDTEGYGLLESLIRRDRNHPSVILWSIGNEEMYIHKIELGRRVVTNLQNFANILDSTRHVTIAVNDSAFCGPAAQAIQVMGFNYLRQDDMDKFRKTFPDKPSFGSEEASSHGTRGVYKMDSVKHYASSYLPILRSWSSTPEQWLQYYADRPWLAGSFIWTGIDYRGEPVIRNWPSTTSCYGVMDICCYPKDHYYCYQAAWTDKPVLHIMPHWNWEKNRIDPIKVWVYSNCDEVELILNDKSLGRKRGKINDHLEWMVNYVPGTLLAKGYNSGELVTQEQVETTDEATKIILNADRYEIDADGEDVAIIAVSVIDSKGRIIPTANNQINFEIEGPGKIIGVGNGDPSSSEPDKANKRKVFNGLAQVIVQSSKQSGDIFLTARSSGLNLSLVKIKAKECEVRPIIP